MLRAPSSWQPVEWKLLGAFCKPDSASANVVAATEWCRQIADWPYFLKLAEHHKIRPLLLKGAARLGVSLPEQVARVLREESIWNAREAFRWLAELQRLLALLSSVGVEATVLKGVPLSLMAYGDVSVREVGDIDLLIDPADAAAADAVLSQSGLLRKEPLAHLTPRRRAFYSKYFKDYTYDADEGGSGFEVDLHWRLVRDAEMAAHILPPSVAAGGREPLHIGSLQMEVLERKRCLLYLAVHGATEGWARRKSLADVAALWCAFTENERKEACALAENSGCAHFVYAALRLAVEWIGPLPECAALNSRRTKGEDGLQDYIVDSANRRLLESQGLPSPAGETSFAMKWHEARVYPAWSSRKALAMRILFRPRIWETVDLPDAFFLLYALFSPAEWLAFRVKRWLKPESKAKPNSHAGSATRWERLQRRSLHEWLLLAEAGVLLIVARAMLKILPTLRIIQWIRRPLRNGMAERRVDMEELRWAVTAFSRNAPIRLVCFPQALALHAMLRRRSVASEVLYGAARSADGKLTAHAWLRCGERVWVGGEVAGEFTVLDIWRPADEVN